MNTNVEPVRQGGSRRWLLVVVLAILVLGAAVCYLVAAGVRNAFVAPAAEVGVNKAGVLNLPQGDAKVEPLPTVEDASAGNEVLGPNVGVRVDPFAGLPECPYTDTGSPQPVALKKVGELYRFDPKSTGCAWVVEGRFPWQTQLPELAAELAAMDITSSDGSAWPLFDVHHIIAGRSSLGAFDWAKYNKMVQELYQLPDSLLDDMLCLECSVWLYDPTWNMSDFSTAKESIAEQLEVKKLRDAMRPRHYLDPRVIWQLNGQMAVFYQEDSGDAAYEAFTGCTAGDTPEEIPVHGLWDGKNFQAAIGAGHCTMAIYIDGASTAVIWDGYQKDGDEIVTYQDKVEAWIFPTDWTRQQVDAWVTTH